MNLKHGHSRRNRTSTYNSWRNMLRRPKRTDKQSKKYYADKGIKVCDRWLEFENFLADMGERPEGYLIDRINPDENYEPSNCRWATMQESQNTKTQRRGRGWTKIKDGQYQVRMRFSGKDRHLGMCRSEEEAEALYKAAVVLYEAHKTDLFEA